MTSQGAAEPAPRSASAASSRELQAEEAVEPEAPPRGPDDDESAPLEAAL